jgi:hypothetical protein
VSSDVAFALKPPHPFTGGKTNIPSNIAKTIVMQLKHFKFSFLYKHNPSFVLVVG